MKTSLRAGKSAAAYTGRAESSQTPGNHILDKNCALTARDFPARLTPLVTTYAWSRRRLRPVLLLAIG